jgi:pyruvate dehydrogenase E2 component (dihydrolipoamide acetyltransferase)
MAAIAIPSIGIAMEEALLVKWLKQPGDEVAGGEPVAEIETDKATMDLESPAAGRLGPHLVEPGAIVPVGTVIAEVVVEGEEPVTPAPVPAAPPRSEPEASVPATTTASAGATSATAAGRTPHARSPRARRLAREQAEGASPSQPERFRNLIATKVAESWRQIPHFAVTREVDAEPMLGALDALRATAGEPAPTFTDLLLRALALALREVDPGSSGDVGLAVATEHGVVIPVVHGVLAFDPAGLARARAAAVARARSGRLSPEDLGTTPSTTLSNLGAMGVDHFTGVIALGQTSLLTVGRAVPRPAALADGTLASRTTFHATLNVDHRAIDGAGAARLLVAFADAAEGMTAESYLEGGP